MSHPGCHGPNGHVCAEPTGKLCVIDGCQQPAGTRWGFYWCPEHDEERLNRVTRKFEDLVQYMDEE